MVHFVGAGPGAPDLITLRGAALLQRADVVIYAGSLVNPALLENTRPGVEIYNSAEMTLEEVLAQMQAAEAQGQDTVRLHTGDPSLYGAVREQMDALDALGIPWDDTPGVSSFCGAAAALGAEYTLPGVSQTLIVTRLAGRTGVPEREALPALAAHGASMALFLSAGNLEGVQQALLEGAYHEDTPAAIVYKATWPDEWCAARWVRWLPPVQRRASPKRRCCWWGHFWAQNMRAASSTTRRLPRRFERGGSGEDRAAVVFGTGPGAGRIFGREVGRHGAALRRGGFPLRLDGEGLYRVRRAGVCGGGRHCRTSHCALCAE